MLIVKSVLNQSVHIVSLDYSLTQDVYFWHVKYLSMPTDTSGKNLINHVQCNRK